MRILLIEDQVPVAAAVGKVLELDRFVVRTQTRGQEALRACRDFAPDLVILDLDLPDVTGFEVCAQLRRSYSRSLPILILSARWEVADKLKGFEMGADDYLTKPFEPRELRARVHALLRALGSRPPSRRGQLVFHAQHHEIELGTERITLTATQFELLRCLARNPGETLSREHLLNEVWGPDYAGSTRTVDLHVAQLRRKLADGSTRIRTVRGAGYQYS